MYRTEDQSLHYYLNYLSRILSLVLGSYEENRMILQLNIRYSIIILTTEYIELNNIFSEVIWLCIVLTAILISKNDDNIKHYVVGRLRREAYCNSCKNYDAVIKCILTD